MKTARSANPNFRHVQNREFSTAPVILKRLGADVALVDHHDVFEDSQPERSTASGSAGGSGAKIPRHRMRGTVLLLESDRSLLVDVDLLRANELIVYHCHELANALKQLQHMAPDVVVAVLSGHDSPSIVPGLRDLADYATSIIVASVPEEREAARKAGADSFLLNSAPPADLLYEIRRALILRRSGRRLPWNW
jgi:hypothetical protein